MKLQQNNPQIPVSEVAARAAAVQAVRAELPQAFAFEAEEEAQALAPAAAAAQPALPLAAPVAAPAVATGWKSRLTRLPLVGTAILWVSALARLVQWRQQLTVEAEHLQAQVTALGQHLNAMVTEVEQTSQLARISLDSRLLGLEGRIHRATEQLGSGVAQLQRVTAQDRSLRNLQIGQLQREAEQDRGSMTAVAQQFQSVTGQIRSDADLTRALLLQLQTEAMQDRGSISAVREQIISLIDQLKREAEQDRGSVSQVAQQFQSVTDQIKDHFFGLTEQLRITNEALTQDMKDVQHQVLVDAREHQRVQADLRADLIRLQFTRAAAVAEGQPVVQAPAASPGLSDQDNNGHSRFYIDFENTFRGEMAAIKERMRPQLRWMPEACLKGEALVVDVGCGRGEWLSLLREQHVRAMGIDLNPDMVLRCTEQGLDVRCADAVQWLREQAPGSFGAVTGFHLIEHLPFEVLLSLFDAALHALRPDGMILFETPNPENLMVGACNFYLDPTHRNPIPPGAAQFMAMQRGFARADILRLHPYDVSSHIKEKGETQDLLNYLLYGPQDYAIAAWKQAAGAPAS